MLCLPTFSLTTMVCRSTLTLTSALMMKLYRTVVSFSSYLIYIGMTWLWFSTVSSSLVDVLFNNDHDELNCWSSGATNGTFLFHVSSSIVWIFVFLPVLSRYLFGTTTTVAITTDCLIDDHGLLVSIPPTKNDPIKQFNDISDNHVPPTPTADCLIVDHGSCPSSAAVGSSLGPPPTVTSPLFDITTSFVVAEENTVEPTMEEFLAMIPKNINDDLPEFLEIDGPQYKIVDDKTKDDCTASTEPETSDEESITTTTDDDDSYSIITTTDESITIETESESEYAITVTDDIECVLMETAIVVDGMIYNCKCILVDGSHVVGTDYTAIIDDNGTGGMNGNDDTSDAMMSHDNTLVNRMVALEQLALFCYCCLGGGWPVVLALYVVFRTLHNVTQCEIFHPYNIGITYLQKMQWIHRLVLQHTIFVKYLYQQVEDLSTFHDCHEDYDDDELIWEDPLGPPDDDEYNEIVQSSYCEYDEEVQVILYYTTSYTHWIVSMDGRLVISI